ncbi:hypothetical protein [Sagittula sp.]|uniref:hypothetical protein n=1 Tax=Sagittula sp. TaxID=2038081 RepID=UPI00351207C1
MEEVMGVLFDDQYWANVTNSMMELRPVRTQPLPIGDATALLKICCRSLSDLVEDKDFNSDLNAALSADTTVAMPFDQFLDEFERMEKAIAMQSGVHERAAADLGRSVRDVQRKLANKRTAREILADTAEKIRYSQKMACAAFRGEVDAMEKRNERSIWQRTWSATKGVSVVSFNASAGAGAMAHLPVVGDLVVGAAVGKSIESGAGMVGDAWRGYW